MPINLNDIAGIGQSNLASNFLNAFSASREMRDKNLDRERADQARALAGQALTGDQNALRGLAGVDPDAYLGVTKHQRENKAYEAERVASVLFSAKTPEEWNQRTNYLRQQGYDVGPEDTWENRDAVINEYLTAKEQYDRDYKERTLAATQKYREDALSIQRKVADLKTDPYELRKKAAIDAGLDPESPDGRSFILTGKLTKPPGPTSAAMEKLIRESEESVVSIQTLGENLRKAGALLDSGNVLEGYMPGTRALAATALPEWATSNKLIPTPAQGEATQNYANIMNLESISQMSAMLKGATTDRELATFVEILSNPNAPAAVKRQTIDRMIALAAKKEALEQDRLARYKTPVPGADDSAAVDAGGLTAEQAQAVEDANAAIAAGANRAAVLKQLQEDFPDLDLGD